MHAIALSRKKFNGKFPYIELLPGVDTVLKLETLSWRTSLVLSKLSRSGVIEVRGTGRGELSVSVVDFSNGGPVNGIWVPR